MVVLTDLFSDENAIKTESKNISHQKFFFAELFLSVSILTQFSPLFSTRSASHSADGKWKLSKMSKRKLCSQLNSLWAVQSTKWSSLLSNMSYNEKTRLSFEDPLNTHNDIVIRITRLFSTFSLSCLLWLGKYSIWSETPRCCKTICPGQRKFM